MIRLNVVLAVLVVLLLHGCGYQFSVEGPGPRIGGSVAQDDGGPVVRLIIRDLLNRTFQRNLEFAYTRYMRQQFAVSSGAQVVAEEAQADYIMKGAIESVTAPSLTFSSTLTRERRVQVVVRVTVEHRQTGNLLWTRAATGTGEFFVNRQPAVESGQDQIQFNRVLRDRALEQAGQQAAEQLASAFLDARDQGVFSSAQSSSDPSTPSLGLRDRSAAPVF